ncbi:ABC transporter permease [Rubellicoccus peritrichatus]|uniref:Transport permease protein n=1 Tax=Rubellicoccus peritrichatus TaxID=3080537 RepID=A0AAQ3QRK1_9BACT|nr:ABC transporter permease [Puniceicoccus sp. CR14]WOO41423.1 ABC transporter permease [Puniceicoccus sp. CR14]
MNGPKSNEAKEWDLIIKPQHSLLDLHLDDLWRYRDLIYMFVRRDFVTLYKQTVLGPAWFILNPLIATIMYTIVFGNIAKLSTDGLPDIIFYMSGTILWEYFSQCLLNTSNTFRSNAGIFGKVYFPRLSVPFSITISQLFKFALQVTFFMCFWLYFYLSGAKIHFTWAAALFPLLVVIMAGIALGSGIIISSLTTKYRDLENLLSFGVRMAMYATPVVYPLSMLAESKYRILILLNPMTPIIETFRFGFFGSGSFSWLHLSYSAAFAIVSLFIGAVIFNRIEKNFMDTV